MKTLLLLKELERFPVFKVKTVCEITGKDRGYAKLVVHRLKKRKLLFEIEKNKYTVHSDPLVIASNIIWPCYITGWSALRFHNMTEQLPSNIFVITTRARKKKETKFNDARIIFTGTKPKYFFGYKKENYQNFQVFVAEREKAIVDAALFKMVSFSEISDIVKSNLSSIDIGKLTNHLIKIRNKALMKRFGFLLDRLGRKEHDKMRRFIDFKYVPLDYAAPGKGEKSKKWRVIDNA